MKLDISAIDHLNKSSKTLKRISSKSSKKTMES